MLTAFSANWTAEEILKYPQTRNENIFQFLSFSSPRFGLFQALCMTLKCVNIARIANADCQSLILNDMIRVSQFFRNSQLYHYVIKSFPTSVSLPLHCTALKTLKPKINSLTDWLTHGQGHHFLMLIWSQIASFFSLFTDFGLKGGNCFSFWQSWGNRQSRTQSQV